MITASGKLKGRLAERPKSCVWCGRPTCWRYRKSERGREVPACMILHAERGLHGRGTSGEGRPGKCKSIKALTGPDLLLR
jgi:hypothetical protein